jgi:ABC-type glycerol-3-phosphate transport system permease component
MRRAAGAPVMSSEAIVPGQAIPRRRAGGWRLQSLLGRLGIHGLLVLGALLFAFPFFWMLSTSLKPAEETMANPPIWWPSRLVWANYTVALGYGQLWTGLLNSTFLALVNMLGELLVCSMVAFSFARLRWPGRDLCFVLLLATMMLPNAITMVPLFIIFKQLGWINTFLPLTVPAFLGSPFYIFLLRQFYMTIPRELDDAARIDGASIPVVWWRILMPLLGPALAAVAIFTFRSTWNDFMGPLIYIDDPQLRPMALALWAFRQDEGIEWNLLMAASVLMTLPMVAVFFLFQRYFTQGITLTGIKG